MPSSNPCITSAKRLLVCFIGTGVREAASEGIAAKRRTRQVAATGRCGGRDAGAARLRRRGVSASRAVGGAARRLYNASTEQILARGGLLWQRQRYVQAQPRLLR